MPSRTVALRSESDAKAANPGRKKRKVAASDADIAARLAFASESLAKSGILRGARTRKLSVRVDPGLIEAARKRTGITKDSDLVNAALAALAARDSFGAWLVSYKGRLPEDFELDF